MEQVSFGELFSNADSLGKEQAIFERIKCFLKFALEKDNLTEDVLLFRAGNAEKSQYSSICLFNEGVVLCRVSCRGKQYYLSVPAEYQDCIPVEAETKVLASDPAYCRIMISSIEDVALYREVLAKIVSMLVDTYPCEFDCCSRYEACSDAMRCIHPFPNFSIKCAYRKNLKKGKVFYGKNRNI